MKYKSLGTFLFIPFTFLYLIGCSLDDQQLKTSWWKYGDGYHIGDVIDFNGRFSLKGDTILNNGQSVGIITGRIKGTLGNKNKIQITSLDKKQSGIYYQ